MPDPAQPRKVFKAEGLQVLADSIEDNGLLQPITVRHNPSGEPRYIIIAGERRWRATGQLGWETVPAIVKRNISEGEAAKLQLLENIVREDLNPVEEAKAIKRFLDEGYSKAEIAKTIGLGAQHLTWRVQMLELREDALHLVSVGQLPPLVAHKMSLLGANGQNKALALYGSSKMNVDEAIHMCNALWSEENQTDMFPETKVSETQRRTARSFADAMEQVAGLLVKLEGIEYENPGALAESLATEIDVAEARITEMVRSLGRVKRALQGRRMKKVAEAA